MKKVLFILLAVALSLPGLTQSSNTVAKNITTADTITWASVASSVKGFQYTATKTSGTVAGKVYLEGTINGTWVAIDSLTLSDVTPAQTKVFPVSTSVGTTYKGYRFRNTNTSSATIAVSAAYLRRPDER